MIDQTGSALHSAMRGLMQRQRVIADNIANVETPRFLAGRVSFEDSLRSAIADGRPQDAEATTARSLQPTRVNGNNVNLDEETLDMVDAGLRYQLTVQAMNGKFSLLRTAIKGQ